MMDAGEGSGWFVIFLYSEGRKVKYSNISVLEMYYAFIQLLQDVLLFCWL